MHQSTCPIVPIVLRLIGRNWTSSNFACNARPNFVPVGRHRRCCEIRNKRRVTCISYFRASAFYSHIMIESVLLQIVALLRTSPGRISIAMIPFDFTWNGESRNVREIFVGQPLQLARWGPLKKKKTQGSCASRNRVLLQGGLNVVVRGLIASAYFMLTFEKRDSGVFLTRPLRVTVKRYSSSGKSDTLITLATEFFCSE